VFAVIFVGGVRLALSRVGEIGAAS
jgi:hypothetical protein